MKTKEITIKISKLHMVVFRNKIWKVDNINFLKTLKIFRFDQIENYMPEELKWIAFCSGLLFFSLLILVNYR